jgi:DNA-binding IclR family transcriptional regulator
MRHPGVTIEQTESMVTLLNWFERQPCSCATVGHISDATEYSRQTVRANLKQLMAGDYAEQRHAPTGEYRLITDPRSGDSDNVN